MSALRTAAVAVAAILVLSATALVLAVNLGWRVKGSGRREYKVIRAFR